MIMKQSWRGGEGGGRELIRGRGGGSGRATSPFIQVTLTVCGQGAIPAITTNTTATDY